MATCGLFTAAVRHAMTCPLPTMTTGVKRLFNQAPPHPVNMGKPLLPRGAYMIDVYVIPVVQMLILTNVSRSRYGRL